MTFEGRGQRSSHKSSGLRGRTERKRTVCLTCCQSKKWGSIITSTNTNSNPPKYIQHDKIQGVTIFSTSNFCSTVFIIGKLLHLQIICIRPRGFKLSMENICIYYFHIYFVIYVCGVCMFVHMYAWVEARYQWLASFFIALIILWCFTLTSVCICKQSKFWHKLLLLGWYDNMCYLRI